MVTNKVNEFAKIKYYRNVVAKILLLSLTLSTFMVIFSLNIGGLGMDNLAILKWIENRISIDKIIVSYKNNIVGGKLFTAYYLFVHPVIALTIVIVEVILGNNSLDDNDYKDFYMYSVEIYGKERGGLKSLLTITVLVYFLFYNGYLNKIINFQFTAWGVLAFNAVINMVLLGLLAVLTLAIHSFLTNYLR